MWVCLILSVARSDDDPASANSDPTLYTYTGGIQTYVVPANAASLTIEAAGAAGGNDQCGINSGGLGGKIVSEVDVVSCQTLYVVVGGVGSTGGGGFNGGGIGYLNPQDECIGGGGGGASDVRSSLGINSRIVVAGGGGGGAGCSTNGLDGGYTTASDGGAGNGTFGMGGAAGGNPAQSDYGSDNGGGGGGYIGGGGGFGFCKAGGGGSSYSVGTIESLLPASNSGNGYVKITSTSIPKGKYGTKLIFLLRLI